MISDQSLLLSTIVLNDYVATVITESLKPKASSIAGVNRERIIAEPES